MMRSVGRREEDEEEERKEREAGSCAGFPFWGGLESA